MCERYAIIVLHCWLMRWLILIGTDWWLVVLIDDSGAYWFWEIPWLADLFPEVKVRINVNFLLKTKNVRRVSKKGGWGVWHLGKIYKNLSCWAKSFWQQMMSLRMLKLVWERQLVCTATLVARGSSNARAKPNASQRGANATEMV